MLLIHDKTKGICDKSLKITRKYENINLALLERNFEKEQIENIPKLINNDVEGNIGVFLELNDSFEFKDSSC